ncbi:MAG: hypothetical protein R3F61_37545 [Myxococcota bacterium]
MLWLSLALADPLTDRCVAEGRADRIQAARLESLRTRSFREPEDVLAELESVGDLAPECPVVWMLAAAVERGRGREDEALAHLDRALDVAGAWPEVKTAHAVAHAHTGEVRYLEAARREGDLGLDLLWIRSLPGSEQVAEWRSLLERYPMDAVAVLAALEGLVEVGHPLEAVEAGLAALERFDDPALAERIARLRAPFEPPPGPRARPSEIRVLDDGTEEVIVYSPARARHELDARLAELGWMPAETVPGGMRYRTQTPVRPFVDVFDDGRVEVQESGVVTLPSAPSGLRVGRTGTRLGTVPSGDYGGVSVSEVISARKLRPDRIRLMEDIWPEVTRWRQARARQQFATHLDEHLPDALQALWDEGVPMYGAGSLDTPAERRRALLDHWGSRACSAEGDAAADRVSRFLRLEVQASEERLTEEEVRAAEVSADCGRTLGWWGTDGDPGRDDTEMP